MKKCDDLCIDNHAEEMIKTKEYDLCIDTHGKVLVLNRGFFEKVNDIVFCDWNDSDYFTFGKYRIRKDDITYNDCHRRAYEKFFKRNGIDFEEVLRKESES